MELMWDLVRFQKFFIEYPKWRKIVDFMSSFWTEASQPQSQLYVHSTLP